MRPKLSVQPRQVFGKKVRALRRDGIVPGNIFGPATDSTAVQLGRVEFKRLFKEVGETELIDVLIEGEKDSRPVLISDVQLDPVSHEPIHVDCYQVNLKEKVEVEVPLEMIGEAPAVREKGAVFLQVLDALTVKALPTEIPHQIEVDISGLVDYGDSLLVKDLVIPEGTEVVTDGEEVVARVEEVLQEEVEPEVSEEDGGGEVADELVEEAEEATGDQADQE